MKYILTFILIFLPLLSLASTTDGTIGDKYAWGENVGWVNFGADQGNIHVTNTVLTGHAWDTRYGWLNLAPDQSGVKNDGQGNLSGSAWSSGGGYVSFTGVKIDATGRFTGIASGGTYGRISFDCDNCKVTTDWRPTPVTTPPPGPIPGSSGSSSGSSGSSIYPPVLQPNSTTVPSGQIDQTDNLTPTPSQPIIETGGTPIGTTSPRPDATRSPESTASPGTQGGIQVNSFANLFEFLSFWLIWVALLCLIVALIIVVLRIYINRTRR